MEVKGKLRVRHKKGMTHCTPNDDTWHSEVDMAQSRMTWKDDGIISGMEISCDID